MNKSLFLLGGFDLEMKEIRALLANNGCRYANRNLKWGARLSDYQDLFNGSDLFIGIELLPDITPPIQYIMVDHHNENSWKASSIEQVAELIGVKLNWQQQLVAANDKGYIPAMIAMGATNEEIQEIRRLDREAQGVTGIDEQLAEESVKNHLKGSSEIALYGLLTSWDRTKIDQLFMFNLILLFSNRKISLFRIHPVNEVRFLKNDANKDSSHSCFQENGNIHFGLNHFNKQAS
jgi:hypothetical protein